MGLLSKKHSRICAQKRNQFKRTVARFPVCRASRTPAAYLACAERVVPEVWGVMP